MVTRVTLKDQKGRLDRMKAVLKLKRDSEGAGVLLNTLVYIRFVSGFLYYSYYLCNTFDVSEFT